MRISSSNHCAITLAGSRAQRAAGKLAKGTTSHAANVDISQYARDLALAERDHAANAKILKVEDEIMGSVIDLKA